MHRGVKRQGTWILKERLRSGVIPCRYVLMPYYRWDSPTIFQSLVKAVCSKLQEERVLKQQSALYLAAPMKR